MRKVYLLTGMIVLSLSSFAQKSITNGGFETGDLSGWTTWQSKEIKLEKDNNNVNTGMYAAKITSGMYSEFNLKADPSTEYEITAATKYIWGEDPFLMVQYYNANTKKLEEIAKVEVPKTKGKFDKVSIKFKTPEGAWAYRFTVVPGTNKGGLFILDDVAINKL